MVQATWHGLIDGSLRSDGRLHTINSGGLVWCGAWICITLLLLLFFHFHFHFSETAGWATCTYPFVGVLNFSLRFYVSIFLFVMHAFFLCFLSDAIDAIGNGQNGYRLSVKNGWKMMVMGENGCVDWIALDCIRCSGDGGGGCGVGYMIYRTIRILFSFLFYCLDGRTDGRITNDE